MKGIKVRPGAFAEVAKAVVQLVFSIQTVDWEIAQDDERIDSACPEGTNKEYRSSCIAND